MKQISLLLLCTVFFSFSSPSKKMTDPSEQYIKDYNMGLESQKQKDYETAITYYQQSISQKQDFADAWNNLAYCYRMVAMTYLNKSGDAYDQALKYEPKHARALEYQGQYFIMLGELNKSFNNYKQLENLDAKEASILKKRLDTVLKQAQNILKNYSPS